MPIVCQSNVNAFPILCQSGGNPVPICFQFQCQSSANNMAILCQSDANQVPIRCQSGANLVPIHRQSNVNQVPIHCQSTNAMPILDQSGNPFQSPNPGTMLGQCGANPAFRHQSADPVPILSLSQFQSITNPISLNYRSPDLMSILDQSANPPTRHAAMRVFHAAYNCKR